MDLKGAIQLLEALESPQNVHAVAHWFSTIPGGRVGAPSYVEPLQATLDVDINHFFLLTANPICPIHLAIIQQLHNVTLMNPQPVPVGGEGLLSIARYGYLLVIDEFFRSFVHVPVLFDLPPVE